MGMVLNNFFNKYYKRIILLICIIVGAIVIYKSIPCFVPFIIAFILASMMEPFIKFLMNKLHLNRKLAATFSLLILIIGVSFLIYVVLNTLIVESKGLLTVLPSYLNDFYINISSLQQKWTEISTFIPSDIVNIFSNLVPELTGVVSNLIDAFIKGTYLTAISLPQKLVLVLTTIVATFFLSSDRDKISLYIHKQLPESWLNNINAIITNMFSAIFKLIKAYITLFFITSAQLWIGFSIMRIPYAFALAFLIGIVDILPILGTGGVLIPWSIYLFISGDVKLGASILILYLVILVVRQILEPKVIGHQIGVYPLVTLIAMYSGLQFAGVIGLMMGPIIVLMVKGILSNFYKGITIKEFIASKSKQADDQL